MGKEEAIRTPSMRAQKGRRQCHVANGMGLRLVGLLTLIVLTSGCATSGIKRVDRSSPSSSRGFVEFRIVEGADFSIMREPLAISITREGEEKRLGFVGSDFNWAPMGYVHRLIVTEAPGTHAYGYVYHTMVKGRIHLIGTPLEHFHTFKLEHYHGIVSIDVLPGKTVPITFSLGPDEVGVTGFGRRLDPRQFKVKEGPPYDGEPQE